MGLELHFGCCWACGVGGESQACAEEPALMMIAVSARQWTLGAYLQAEVVLDLQRTAWHVKAMRQ